MLQFQPPGFEQRAIATASGVVAYYTPVQPWAGPPLLFLHSLGGGSSAYEWSKVYPAFVSTHRVIAPDLPGWGQSSHPPRDYQPEDYFTAIAELIEQLQLAPAIAVASSLTAALLVRLAVQRPELLQLLILVVPSGYGDFGLGYRQGLAAQLASVPGLDRVIYQLGAANELAVRNFLQQFLFARPERITNEMVAAYLASAQQFNAEYAALASLRGDLCFDLARYLPQLGIPTVMVWGDRARFTSLQTGRRLASLNPAVIKGFHAIADAGTLPHLETPAAVIAAMQPYLTPS